MFSVSISFKLKKENNLVWVKVFIKIKDRSDLRPKRSMDRE